MPSSGLLTLYHPALDAGSSPAWIPVFTGMTHSLSSSTESKALRIGDLVLPGFPFWREWHTLCHPQPKAKRFGLGIQSCLDSRLRGNDGRGAWMTKGDTGMTSGMRMTIDKLRTMLNNPTGQTPRYSLFCYLKWLHPCGKPQGIQLSWNKRKCCVSRESNHKYQNLFANWRSKSPLPRRQLHRPAGF